MSTGLPSYPATKPSGATWLGDVPEHWHVLPGRACYREKAISNTGLLETQVLSLSYGRIIVRPEEKLHGLVPESFETYQIVNPGDIICRGTDLQNDHKSLRFGLARHRGIITSAYMNLGTQECIDNEYGYLLLHAYDLKKVFYGLGSGLRQNLGWDDFKYLPFALPPLPEQRAIVRYLDHHDRLIRRYLRSKRRLIALLEEQKQAIIQQAVTRGLDPSVPMKDSGVAWLGEIPAHWEAVPNRALMKAKKAVVGEHSSDYLLLSLTLGGVVPRDLDNPTGKFPSDFSSYQAVKPYDLVFCLFDMDETPRTVGLARQTGMVTGAYSVYKPISAELSEYVYRFYLAMDHQKRLRPFYTGLRKVIQSDTFSSIKIPLPPKPERIQITRYITSLTESIDEAIQHTRREVDLVDEYRTRLIADVVTGKVDVRAAAAALPEVEPEMDDGDEPLDDDGDDQLDADDGDADDGDEEDEG